MSCDRTSNCSGDSTPPWGTEQACSHRLAGQCGPYWSDYMGCEQSHQQCLASGATDQNTVDSICHLQHEIYLQCCEGPDSGTDPKGCSP